MQSPQRIAAPSMADMLNAIRLANAAPAMADVLQAIDLHWSDFHPGGPASLTIHPTRDLEFRGLWEDLRAALKAAGVEVAS